MPRPLFRRTTRALTALLGLPALLLGSLTASALTSANAAASLPASTSPASAQAASGAVASLVAAAGHHHDGMMCDPIRFGTTADTASAAGASGSSSFPTRFDLPDNFQPEGIAIAGGKAYFGSRADGAIYRADLRTGNGGIINRGPGELGAASLGMKIDDRGRLFVAGAGGGNGRVIDTKTGHSLASYTFTTATLTFVNDVILTKDAAWFTDSRQPVLYKVPLGRDGKLPKQSAVRTIPLTGDYEHNPTANNGNGISLTPDGRALIIVQSSSGFLFRVNPRTGVTQKIDLGGAVMTAGDGLLRSKNTLYVVQNRLNKIAVLDLNKSGTSGKLVREITSADFDVPTTAAFFGDRIYLPNARFTTPPTPTTPYWVTAVHR